MLKGLVRAVFLLRLEVDDLQGSRFLGVKCAVVEDGATEPCEEAAKDLLSVVVSRTNNISLSPVLIMS